MAIAGDSRAFDISLRRGWRRFCHKRCRIRIPEPFLVFLAAERLALPRTCQSGCTDEHGPAAPAYHPPYHAHVSTPLTVVAFHVPRSLGSGSNPLRRGLPKRLPSIAKQMDDWVTEAGGDRAIYRCRALVASSRFILDVAYERRRLRGMSACVADQHEG